VKKEFLRTVNEERDFLHTIRRGKADCIGHILRRNCLLKHVFGRRGRGKEMQDGRTRKKT